ncbi:MAG: hypothetical protein WAQ28_03720 [Bacteroidia bacterium]
MAFELRIDARAYLDVDEAVAGYMKKSVKAAEKLYTKIEQAYDSLELNPFFQVRYMDYRCLPIKGFPYMFHFTIDEDKKLVFIHALICTDKDPDKNWLK